MMCSTSMLFYAHIIIKIQLPTPHMIYSLFNLVYLFKTIVSSILGLPIGWYLMHTVFILNTEGMRDYTCLSVIDIACIIMPSIIFAMRVIRRLMDTRGHIKVCQERC